MNSGLSPSFLLQSSPSLASLSLSFRLVYPSIRPHKTPRRSDISAFVDNFTARRARRCTATITARLSHLERERERESLKGSRNRGKLVRAAWKNEIKIPWKSWLTSATVLETFNPAGHCEMPLARFSYSFFPDDVTARKWKGKQKEGNLASFHTATSLLILPPLFPSHILHRVLITNFHTAPRELDENGSSNFRIRISHT